MGNIIEKHADMRNNIEKQRLLDAAERGDFYSVEVLVEQGVDKCAQGEDRRTPLHLAAARGHLDVVRYLVEQGVDKERRDEYGETALVQAALFQHLDVVRYLVEQGANKHHKNAYEESALIRAVELGHVDVVRYLFQQSDQIDEDGKIALSWAAGFGQIDVVRYFVEQGVDKDSFNQIGKTPLVHAVRSGYLEVVRYLIEQGADKDKTDEVGISPLLWAAWNGNSRVLRYLVEQGADMNGQTAVIWAAQKANLLFVQRLVQNKADPTGIDKDGNSVLLLLLNHRYISEDKLLPVVKLLLDHGTSPLVTNNEGKSATSIAISKRFHRIIAMVEEHRIAALMKKYAAKQSASRLEPETEETLSWYISPGDVVKVGAVLAAGSFGIVYHAKWAHIDVVVKEVFAVELQRFLKEVNTWRNLRHANIVPFYGANHRNKPYFIVSEYAKNGELVPYLKSKKQQGMNFVWRKLKEVAIGLGYLHTHGLGRNFN
ncbi:TKL protein kinase [Phytophthora palmivora]|uniref:TKL protein kinase n=1 Tax=Phytophthora palmivora TaxID=4796 RepID=A0A2P4X1C6_9STRA|nr:TKL protein kinase [Phytophthora palmivora]